MSESLKLLKLWASGNAPDVVLHFSKNGEPTNELQEATTLEFASKDTSKGTFPIQDATRYKTYTLGTILFFLQEYAGLDWSKGLKGNSALVQRDVAYQDYFRKATALSDSITNVSLLDLRDLFAYLTTDQATSINISDIDSDLPRVDSQVDLGEEMEFAKTQAAKERTINNRKTIMTLRPGNNKVLFVKYNNRTNWLVV
jgi:hypothetical protein